MKNLDRITFNPDVMGGKPCLRGLRVTVGTIVGRRASGQSNADILQLYPYLEQEDIQQSLAYAAWRVEEIELPAPRRTGFVVAADCCAGRRRCRENNGKTGEEVRQGFEEERCGQAAEDHGLQVGHSVDARQQFYGSGREGQGEGALAGQLG